MKYTVSYILIFCLMLALFTACGEAPESPTDVMVSVVESAVKENAMTEESSVVSQGVESVVSKEESDREEPAQTTSSKTPVSSVSSMPSKVTSKPTVSQGSSASEPVQSTDGLVADIIVEYPTFTKETALKEWLLGNHADYFADGRNDMLSAMGNKGTVTYYKPSIPSNHSLFTLSQVEAHTPSGGMEYCYNDVKTEKQGLYVSVNHPATLPQFTRITDYMYDAAKAKYLVEPSDLTEETVVYRYTYKDIDFYYYRYLGALDNIDTISVYWRQFDTSQMATVQAYCDQIEEIIPLLYLQQVKVDNNTVIQ